MRLGVRYILTSLLVRALVVIELEKETEWTVVAECVVEVGNEVQTCWMHLAVAVFRGVVFSR